MTKKTWDTIPVDTQKILREVAEKTGKDIRAQARKEMTDSVEAMTKRGLKVHKLTPEAEIAWRKVVENAYPKIRGALVPAELFDEVLRLLAEYRADHGKPGQ